jgi:hypothetical protein
MNTPIFPKYIYPIGDLPGGRFVAEVGARGFQYTRELPDLDFDLPELDFDDDEPDTLVDDDPPTLRDEEVQEIQEQQPWYQRALAWWRRAA